MATKSKIILIAVIIILLALAGWLGVSLYKWWQIIKQIITFDDCAKKYPVIEGNPQKCQTPDGRTFEKRTFDEYIKKKFFPPNAGCTNLCGDEICQEVVCEAIGCPCPETSQTCPADCK